MKLIVTGASGYVGNEIIRQSLLLPGITTVVAVARKSVSAPPGLDPTKLKSVVVEDYGTYPAHVKKEFAGAAACLWTVGITPNAYKSMGIEQARKICVDFTVAGFRAMNESGPSRPFRFLYMSGADAEPDQSKTPKSMPEYYLMRGETENQVFKFAQKHSGDVEACVARPDRIINESTDISALGPGSGMHKEVPIIRVESVAAALLHQAVNGFEKEILWTEDLKRLAEEK